MTLRRRRARRSRPTRQTPAWSPDGTRLAYSRRLALETPIETSGIFVRGVSVDLDETPLVRYTGFVWDLTWAK
jgi:Tol biopolymer transport system component